MKYSRGLNLEPEDALGLVQAFVSIIGTLAVEGDTGRILSPDGGVVLEVRLRLSTDAERREGLVQ